MTKEELRNKFDALYAYMAMSKKTEYMMLFGDVMKEMMAWMIENKPEASEKYIETLCAIKWRQYLTREEATSVVQGMIPPAPWSYDSWMRTMEELQLEWEREGVFNRYAMWVAMSQIYTDFGGDLAKVIGKPLAEIPADVIVPLVHRMAISLLTDADNKYHIRAYHLSEKGYS